MDTNRKNLYSICLSCLIVFSSYLSLKNDEPLTEYMLGNSKRNIEFINYNLFKESEGDKISLAIPSACEDIGRIIINNIQIVDYEFGGEVYFDSGRLRFDTIPNKNRELLSYYNQVLDGDLNNIDMLISFFRSKNNKYYEIDHGNLAESLEKVKNYELCVDDLPNELILASFRNSYNPSEKYPRYYRGDLLANWHIHLSGSEPSRIDLEKSKKYPGIVISHFDKGYFDVYYNSNGFFDNLGRFHSEELEKFVEERN